MAGINTILVPVDFSPVAANAFRFALRFADRYPARINLLYGMPTALSSPGMDRIIVARSTQLREEAVAQMKTFKSKGINDTMNRLTGIPEVLTFIEAGDLNEIIEQRIATGETDLVIMGSAGVDKPLSTLVGTNTTLLIDEVYVPVLVVPDETAYRPPEKICYATDLRHLDPFRIDEVLELLAPFHPSTEFVHVATPANAATEYNLSLLRKVMERSGFASRMTFTRLSGTDEVEVLLRHVRRVDADLLVMNRPRRGWLARLWKGSRTRRMMLEAEIPLLILHEMEGGA